LTIRQPRSALLCLFALLIGLLSLSTSANSPRPLLYEVRSSTSTVYLFGTIHVGTASMYPLDPAALAAFHQADALVLEADPTDQSSVVAAMAEALYSPPDSLAQHISAELFREVNALLPMGGISVDYVKQLRPHLLAMVLSIGEVQRLGYDPALGLDLYFAKEAKILGKPILQLESMADQMAMFHALPARVQEDMLRATVDNIKAGKTKEDLDELVSAWLAGDPDAILQALVNEVGQLDSQSAAVLRSIVFDQRNVTMAQRVEMLLREQKSYFVAVGAAHLAGATGLPALLEKKGFTVRRR